MLRATSSWRTCRSRPWATRARARAPTCRCTARSPRRLRMPSPVPALRLSAAPAARQKRRACCQPTTRQHGGAQRATHAQPNRMPRKAAQLRITAAAADDSRRRSGVRGGTSSGDVRTAAHGRAPALGHRTPLPLLRHAAAPAVCRRACGLAPSQSAPGPACMTCRWPRREPARKPSVSRERHKRCSTCGAYPPPRAPRRSRQRACRRSARAAQQTAQPKKPPRAAPHSKGCCPTRGSAACACTHRSGHGEHAGGNQALGHGSGRRAVCDSHVTGRRQAPHDMAAATRESSPTA